MAETFGHSNIFATLSFLSLALASVKSVTNTEVELTGELSVIAAEMPYFIYNDNDTEVEVSIIVSSSDADNVQYDSEHFKGTLVDKTFTDEDMEEADHYVLSGGSNFVWVKDAGTLAAGKCWIELTQSPANARALSIVHEGDLTPTGISTVSSSANTDGNIYDLSGRRVMQPTRSAEGRLFPKGLRRACTSCARPKDACKARTARRLWLSERRPKSPNTPAEATRAVRRRFRRFLDGMTESALSCVSAVASGKAERTD